MTDKQTNTATTGAPAKTAAPTLLAAAPPAPAPKSGRGLAAFALLVALGAGGASGYLWYLGQQEQIAQTNRLDAAIKQAIAQRDPEFQALKAQVQQLQAIKSGLEQLRSDNQALKEQMLGLSGDLQPLKNAVTLGQGETEVVKNENKLLRESHDAHKSTVQQQKQNFEQQLKAQREQLAALGEQLKSLKLSNGALQENLETLKSVAARGGDVNAFPLAEVDYLLRLADSKLKLERNVTTARLALESAQQRLKAVDETGLAPIQTQLSEAIASLRGVKLPDYSALAHKLVSMEDTLDKLPVRLNSGVPDIKNQVKPATSVALSNDAERSWWERGSEAVWNQFKGIVVIRHQRSEAPPLIAMENEFFLRQNLRLELDSMRAALLRGDATSYQDAYILTRDWTERYFDTQDAQVSTFLAELQALQAVPFNTYIPDLTGLRQSFAEFLAHRQPVRAVRPAAPAAAPKPVAPAAEPPATEPPAATEGAQS